MYGSTHRGMVGTTIWRSSGFSDLDFADDVAFFVEMLSILVPALEVMDNEAQPLGVSIN